MNEFFDVKISSRFLFVNILPTLLLTVVVGGLVAAGAPSESPAWSTLLDNTKRLGWAGALLLVFTVVTLSFVLHPLSYPLIQLLEGYWEGLPLGSVAVAKVSARYKRWHRGLNALRGRRTPPALMWLPENERSVRPTALGNVMKAGEVRAGKRYGYRTEAVLQQLLPIASADVREEVNETRNQLDTAVRLCISGLVAVPTTTILLWSYELWLLLPLGCYLFAWAAYRSSIAAATRFSEALSVLVDLHRLQLWDALSLPRPATVEEERSHAALLSDLLDDTRRPTTAERQRLIYVPGASPSEAENAKHASPPAGHGLGRGRRWLIKMLGGQIPAP
jgi:hypothetical protein